MTKLLLTLVVTEWGLFVVSNTTQKVLHRIASVYGLYSSLHLQMNVGFLLISSLFLSGSATPLEWIFSSNRADRICKNRHQLSAEEKFLLRLCQLYTFLSKSLVFCLLIVSSLLHAAGFMAFSCCLQTIGNFWLPSHFAFGTTIGKIEIKARLSSFGDHLRLTLSYIS